MECAILVLSCILSVRLADGSPETQMDSLAGYQKSGKGPTVIFINHFYTLPMESYPHKINGPTKETPPDERFLLPDYLTYMYCIFLTIFSIIILLHLLRRRPIDHFTGLMHTPWNKEEESQFVEMKDAWKSDSSRHFFYKHWTNHVSTSQKLSETFERDFDPVLEGMSDNDYAKKKKLILDIMRLVRRNELVDDDN